MTIKILQLNINSDNYWDQLISFITDNDFDILDFQEVTGKDTLAGNIHSQRDIFSELLKHFGDKYDAELAITQRYASSPFAYMGNATFFKKSFTILEKKEIALSTFSQLFPTDGTIFEKIGRKILYLKLSIANKKISFLNTHFAWAKSPIEEPHQTKQGEIFIDYLRTVPVPFILTGDFNLDPQQPFIQKINKLSRNLIDTYHITNTLNPNNHRVKSLFPPGVAVDYIFTSNDLEVKNFSVINEDISDHLGLTAEIEI
jgi:endonuclease/exonuclease/phosphatase family metal-dependent hydrolase